MTCLIRFKVVSAATSVGKTLHAQVTTSCQVANHFEQKQINALESGRQRAADKHGTKVSDLGGCPVFEVHNLKLPSQVQ